MIIRDEVERGNLLTVQVIIQGVQMMQDCHPRLIAENICAQWGGVDAAAVWWPGAKEVGVQFQMEEETFAELCKPVEVSDAA